MCRSLSAQRWGSDGEHPLEKVNSSGRFLVGYLKEASGRGLEPLAGRLMVMGWQAGSSSSGGA